jgi:hypothetical protein
VLCFTACFAGFMTSNSDSYSKFTKLERGSKFF